MKRLISIFACALIGVSALAQEVEVKDYNALRTNTWSIRAGGGAAMLWGGDLMKNTAPSPWSLVSPYAEVGVNFNIRPWVRLGLGYTFSKFHREQRFDAVQPDNTAFRELQMLTHSADLMAEFNLLEMFGKRNQRWNLYLGTGFGYRFGIGRDYTVGIGGTFVQNASSLQINEWFKATNTHVSVKGPYIPARLSLEYDILPRISVGCAVGYEYGFKKDFYLPGSRAYAGLVFRVNLVGNKHGYYTRAQQRDYFKDKYEKAEAGRLSRERAHAVK